MKFLRLLLLIIFPTTILFAQNNTEFRATWVVTWEWTRSNASIESQKARIREILDFHKKANMNAVLWQVRQSGSAYYPSSFEPWGYYLGYQNPGFDPLAYAVQEAHGRGLEFHAWFNVFQTSSTRPGTPAAKHPEWICRDRDGIPMTAHRAVSPGLKSVRDYTRDVAMEIVNKYDIDGLHLDYVRWSEYTNSSQSQQLAKIAEMQQTFDGMISEAQLADLQTNLSGRYLYDIEHPYSSGVPSGFNSWEDWWRWSVTEFVRTLHDSIQAVKPWVRLSPAALGKYNWSGWNGYHIVFQDAALWFNEGYVEQLTPMLYHWLTGPGFYSALAGGSSESWAPYIQPGIAAGRLFSAGPGSYRFDENNVWNRHPEVIETIRKINWVDGFQFFSFKSWENHKYWQQASTTFFNRITKIRATKSIVDSLPDSPVINLVKIDSLTYQIEVTPPAAINADHRFAIYRSNDEAFDVAADEIINIHFGKENYVYQDQFTGLQDYNGTYYYFATTLDRYWNESNISNFTHSDSIPSFAPTVTNSFPEEGDTVSVKTQVSFSFSKTMDINTFENAFSVFPDVQIERISWSETNKKVTVFFIGNFEFGTNYSVTISPALMDVNGKPIDGNGDGIPGDSLLIQFVTLDFDVDGPRIQVSNPDYSTKDEEFDVEDVISVLFDELIEKNMINDTTLFLFQGVNEVPFNFNLFDVGAKSVVHVQSTESLQMNSEYSLLLKQSITDTTGNPIGEDISIPFKTDNHHYYETTYIDQFNSVTNWKRPDYSGSTKGIDVPNTSFEVFDKIYLPNSKTALQKIVARLKYKWDISETSHLIREYLAGGAPRAVEFDTSYTLQCFIFGDASNTKFRFALDEAVGSSWPNHEVSKWRTIDWVGWKLVEWKLSDPATVGSWIGNQILDGSKYRVDSFQLTYEPGAAISGQIYFDNFRIVRKSSAPVAVKDRQNQQPREYKLGQNYPNPFNPSTTIPFTIAKSGKVVIKIYDNSGREVATLVDKHLPAGRHSVTFDASNFAAGIFYYQMINEGQVLTGKMVYVK